MHALRATLARVALETEYLSTDRVRLGIAQTDAIRLRLLKVAARVSSSVRRALVQLPRAFPLPHAFVAVAQELGGHVA